MLSGDFYTISQQTTDSGYFKALIFFNAGHAIFDGHFPGQPVVPGVCMMQVVHEQLQDATHQKLRLKKASDLKFLHVIVPDQHPQVWLELKFQQTDASFEVNATLFWEETIFFKCKASFLPNDDGGD